MSKTGRILVVDDDEDVLVAARLLLKRHFAVVQTESDPGRLDELLGGGGFDVTLLDMNFALGANTGEEGFNLLQRILQIDPAMVVILMTAYGSVATAVKAIKAGATDFVLKPWQNEKLVASITAALQLHSSRHEVARLKSQRRELISAPGVRPIIGDSAAMQKVFDVIRRAAPTDVNVLILGENGTGKELVAREIHQRSTRAQEIFMAVDLGAVSESLFESELFGHRKGAFTDARQDRSGRFLAASGGTLFLDEIGNLPLHLQGKLLSVLEQRQVVPVGGDHPVAIDVRLICATNKPIKEMAGRGEFREDLLYRVNTVEIDLPALRERADDIPELLTHFVNIYARKYNLPNKRLTAGAIRRLQSCRWPGNVRELRHSVERALIMSEGDMLDADAFFVSPDRPAGRESMDFENCNLEAVEERVIQKVLARHNGNVSRAAKELGITRASLYRRMEKYGF